MKMKLPLPKPSTKIAKKPQQLALLNQRLNQLSQQFKQALAQEDYQRAYECVHEVIHLVPDHRVAYMDLAYTALRLKRFDAAYQHYQKALELSEKNIDPNIYDGLTEVAYFLNQQEQVRHYGHLSLKTKQQQVASETMIALPHNAPPPISIESPEQNIIAFSLFGDQPRYCETAILNVIEARKIYPEWRCRFYVDESVPSSVLSRLQQHGAQLVLVSPEQQQISGLFWRFFVMDDPEVKRFLIRDADSLISMREREAVDEWLQSDRWFHVMRDYYSHTELILAGMWGGCTGIFHQIETSIRQYIASGRYLNERVIDQHFLRYCIWPTLQQSVITHDRYLFADNASRFPQDRDRQPDWRIQYQHVGMNESAATVSVTVNHPDAVRVKWVLFNQMKQIVCQYSAQVLSNRSIEIHLPENYVEKIRLKAWNLQIYPYEN